MGRTVAVKKRNRAIRLILLLYARLEIISQVRKQQTGDITELCRYQQPYLLTIPIPVHEVLSNANELISSYLISVQQLGIVTIVVIT